MARYLPFLLRQTYIEKNMKIKTKIPKWKGIAEKANAWKEFRKEPVCQATGEYFNIEVNRVGWFSGDSPA